MTVFIKVYIYMQPVTISYASEENDQGILDDPVKDTYFYTKAKPWQAIKGDDVSNMRKWCSNYLTSLCMLYSLRLKNLSLCAHRSLSQRRLAYTVVHQNMKRFLRKL